MRLIIVSFASLLLLTRPQIGIAQHQQCSAGRSIRDGTCKEGEPLDIHDVPCTGPIEPKELFGSIDFEQKYWRKRPVLIRRHCPETYDALALGDLSRMFPDAIASGEEAGQIQLSSFRDGDEYVRIIMFYANIFLGYLDGASVVYNQVDTMWPHAAAFIKGLTEAFPFFKADHPPSMNLYITPPGSSQVCVCAHCLFRNMRVCKQC